MKTASRQRLDVFRSVLVRGAKFSAEHEFPLLSRAEGRPARAVPFEKASTARDRGQWVHFYTHDRQFECLWNRPERYLPLLRRFEGVISPDFSLYREMPLAMQIWNTYRNRALAFWLQHEGVTVIPNVRWGDTRTYAFAFEGLPTGGTVAVSTNGLLRSKRERGYFAAGLACMVATLAPEVIINYSQTPDDIFEPYKASGIDVVALEHYSLRIRKEVA